MNDYVVTYWVERNDCATDLEIIVQAEDEEKAIEEFKKKVFLYKRVESITKK